jgi:hypothetical protein
VAATAMGVGNGQQKLLVGACWSWLARAMP